MLKRTPLATGYDITCKSRRMAMDDRFYWRPTKTPSPLALTFETTVAQKEESVAIVVLIIVP